MSDAGSPRPSAGVGSPAREAVSTPASNTPVSRVGSVMGTPKSPQTPQSNQLFTPGSDARSRSDLGRQPSRAGSQGSRAGSHASRAGSQPSKAGSQRSLPATLSHMSTPDSLGRRRGEPDTPGTPASVAGRANGRRDPPATPPLGGDPMGIGADEDGAEVVIWGTNINITNTRTRFHHFINNYREDADPDEDPDASDYEDPPLYYIARLEEMQRSESFFLEINGRHLWNHDKKLYDQLVKHPMEIMGIMDVVLCDEFKLRFGENALGEHLIQARPFNLKIVKPLRELDPENIDQLIALRGMVIRCSSIIPDMKQAFFRCIVCSDIKKVHLDRGRIEEPTLCGHCNTKSSYEVIHNRCVFRNKQMVRLQEVPDEIPEGETPHSVTLFTFDALVDEARPGDRVEVTGVFRAIPKRLNPKMRVVRSVYKTYIDVVHFRGGSASSSDNIGDADAAQVEADLAIPPERLRAIKQLAADPDVYSRLVEAIAPSIWELDDVKKGILCQMLGGVDRLPAPRKKDEGGEGMGEAGGFGDSDEEEDGLQNENDVTVARSGTRIRGEINILMCGDPGTSKSQLLAFVHKTAPRGIYCSGKGSSSVGLTASVVKDPDTRDLVLESGALVLSDNGVCCIDEFDKMADTTRAVLHEAMEQQTVSIAKAGIICTLNARTAILASANPKESRYNPRLSVIENIKLPPTLLSRFDLIYLILDTPNEDSDRRLARHLVGLYYEQPVTPSVTVTQELLRDFVKYARAHIRPRISEEASQELIKGYLDMRRLGSGGKTITATPRQLEGLIRISEALAKMRFDKFVLKKDVREAIRLMEVSTQSAATDARTGTIDMDMINTGRGALDREGLHALTVAVRAVLEEHGRGRRMQVTELRKTMARQSDVEVQHSDLLEVLQILADDGIIIFNERAQSITLH